VEGISVIPNKYRHNPGRVRAIFYAVLVHAAVIGLLVIGFRWSVQPSSDEPVVQAVAVPEPVRRQPPEVDKRAQEEEEARKKAEAEKHRQAELQKKQEEEKARAETLKRQAIERKQQEAAKQEQQKRAAAQERQQEEKRRQKLTEQSLQEQLAAEEKERTDAAHAARTVSEVSKYKALIQQRVIRSWNRPVGAAKGMKCVVSVRLTPGGEVLSATVVQSSGNAQFDRSAEYAVYKAAPLPLPQDPSLFDNFREFNLDFNPKE
jgi:colicin import membrane protein